MPSAISERLALVLSDVVDSTRLAQALGDAAMSGLWAAHDRDARAAIRRHGGREIGRTDGLLAAFPTAAAADAFAAEYHASLAELHPLFRARVGLHWGEVLLRANPADDVAGGATPFEVDGVALPLAARVMAVAQGGQTLATADLVEALAPERRAHARGHGHWRFKGLSDPVALFELPAAAMPPTLPPADGEKGYRVVRDASGEWMPARAVPHNLPPSRDRFVGRGEVLQAIAERFDTGTRLLTLLGIGGIGKTRSALAFGRHTLGDFPGGVWWCDLSAASGIDGIAYAVAHALDVPLGRGDALRKLGQVIDGRGACLVVLDNFEQVARHAEACLGPWLLQAPGARFLVTSRERLGLVGEQVLRLPPLPEADAVALFVDRANAAGAPSPDTGDASLLELVRMLDQLPLAVELAAARAPLLSPRQMLERMSGRFQLLAAPGGRPERQSTLRRTLDWSWDLLEADERQALAQASVFEGGFTLEAAEAVLRLDGSPLEPTGAAGAAAGWGVAQALEGLLRKSLLRADARHRFELLRSVQDYAAERLDAMAGRATAEARHATHFATFDEEQAAADRGIELDNLVVACRRSIGHDAARASRTLLAAWSVLRLRGPFSAVLELAGGIESAGGLAPADRIRVDRVIGGACSLLGDPGRAATHFARCAEVALAQAELDTAATVLAQLAALELAAGHADIADSRLDEAIGLVGPQAAPVTRIRVLSQLGALRQAQGRLDEARDAHGQALAIAERAGLRRWIGGARGNLGAVALMQGERDEARRHLERALEQAREIGDRQWEGNARCNLGLLLHELGEGAAAQRELHAAIAIARAIGHKRLEALAACNLGMAQEAEGQLAAAAASHELACARAGELQDEPLASRLAGYLGLCLVRDGRVREAQAALQSAAQGYALVVGDPQSAAILAAQLSIAARLSADAPAAARWFVDAQARVAGLELDPAGEAARLLEECRRLGQGSAAGQLS